MFKVKRKLKISKKVINIKNFILFYYLFLSESEVYFKIRHNFIKGIEKFRVIYSLRYINKHTTEASSIESLSLLALPVINCA